MIGIPIWRNRGPTVKEMHIRRVAHIPPIIDFYESSKHVGGNGMGYQSQKVSSK